MVKGHRTPGQFQTQTVHSVQTQTLCVPLSTIMRCSTGKIMSLLLGLLINGSVSQMNINGAAPLQSAGKCFQPTAALQHFRQMA